MFLSKRNLFLTVGWGLVILALFFYSFTQIDLGLTLTQVSFWQVIQTNFQLIGYFNRPLSTALFLVIMFFLTLFYLFFLYQGGKGNLKKKFVWRLVFLTAFILLFSYNAFSHDLFNYIFDAKIVTFYHDNPYQHKALDYHEDPMLGFMHWTHRTYPYGPLWLGLTVPLSFFGFQKLLLTIYLFKGLVVASYLVICWVIYQILARTKGKKEALLGLVFFAFNPLVIIEGLVSAHNDLVMMAFLMLGLFFLVREKRLPAFLFLGLSIVIKFATGLLLPIFLIVVYLQIRKKKINWDWVWLLSVFLMLGGIIAAALRLEFQPWYVFYCLPLLALLVKKQVLQGLSLVFSIGLLFYYVPFLYLGNWDPPIPTFKIALLITLGAFSLIWTFFFRKSER